MTLSPAAIAALPKNLQLELHDAVLALDASRISRTVEQVTEYNPALSSAIARFAARLAYTPILDAVERAAKQSGANGV